MRKAGGNGLGPRGLSPFTGFEAPETRSTNLRPMSSESHVQFELFINLRNVTLCCLLKAFDVQIAATEILFPLALMGPHYMYVRSLEHDTIE